MWKKGFSGDFCKKIKKDLLGSGPFSRDGRVTGNKHLFFRPYILLSYNCITVLLTIDQRWNAKWIHLSHILMNKINLEDLFYSNIPSVGPGKAFFYGTSSDSIRIYISFVLLPRLNILHKQPFLIICANNFQYFYNMKRENTICNIDLCYGSGPT